MDDRITDILLSTDPLDAGRCLRFVSGPEVGGIVSFVGTVRDRTRDKRVVRLEFEAYEPMAVAEMWKIVEEIRQKWAVSKIAIHHRVGILEIGDIPVVIAVGAPHRQAAFEACQYAIDTLKQTVPIWKKEVFEDGEVWVAAHP